MSTVISSVSQQYMTTMDALHGVIANASSETEERLLNSFRASQDEDDLNTHVVFSQEHQSQISSIRYSDSDSDSDSDSFFMLSEEEAEFAEYFNSDANPRRFLENDATPKQRRSFPCTNFFSRSSKSKSSNNFSPVNVSRLSIETEKPRYSHVSGYTIVKFSDMTFVGSFHKKQESGDGICYVEEGNIYVGHFDHYQLNGHGLIIYPNGERYEGEVKNNCRHGAGMMYRSSGNCIRGTWIADKQEGRGILYYKDGGRYESIWCNDVMGSKGLYIRSSSGSDSSDSSDSSDFL